MRALRLALLVASFEVLSVVLASAGDPATLPGGYRVQPVAEAATLTGRIVVAGDRPSMAPLPVTADRAVCGPAFKPNEALVASPDGGVGNCVVSLEDITAGKAPSPETTRCVMDQQSCIFTPHVAQAWANSPMLIKNSDPVYHNVHAYSLPGMYTRFNVALPVQGTETRVQSGKPEMMVLKCDAGHRWMTAYIHVAGNPYHCVTQPDGNFTITGIPAGRHTLRIWHELANDSRTEVECPKGTTVRLSVTLRLKPARSWSIEPQAGH